SDAAGATTTGTVNITITPVNDAPVLANKVAVNVDEGASVVIADSDLRVTDADNVTSQIAYTVTGGPSNGRLELTTGPGVAISSFTQADIDAGRLNYVHDGSETTSDAF
ncbi:MAG: hypothetical protein GTO67_06110, partial [Gammaproteobacteria bacterium]|nr:hypothetical protein [Gammaproteobacteria bacterium]NIM72804.1 hypothetical protein [Gammaproteobacteria bacterium]NIN38261.1 hypothetical protein [Gammaproteobacteria bacterium]NIO24552.1 hypothetical protein [Gammaproteobacteria bacterium]NIO65161.1 hypothetical protein [Gammaproteobacteria bacterium]